MSKANALRCSRGDLRRPPDPTLNTHFFNVKRFCPNPGFGFADVDDGRMLNRCLNG